MLVVEHPTGVMQTEVCGNKANDDDSLVIRSPEASELVCSNEKSSEAEKSGNVAVDSSQTSGKTEAVLPLDGFEKVSVEIEVCVITYQYVMCIFAHLRLRFYETNQNYCYKRMSEHCNYNCCGNEIFET